MVKKAVFSDILYLLYFIQTSFAFGVSRENGAKLQNPEKILIIDLCLLYVKYFTNITSYFQDSPSSYQYHCHLTYEKTKAHKNGYRART